MKREFRDSFREYKTDTPEEIFAIMQSGKYAEVLFGPDRGRTQATDGLGEVHSLKAYRLLAETNPLKQHYYYIENEEHYAFFTTYENRMNLFTYGKAEWYMNIQTVGYPCSLSISGFVTDDEKWLFEYIKTIRGCKLVLNVDRLVPMKGMSIGETLPTCRLSLRPEYTGIDAYIASLRSSYRRRLHLAEERCRDITVKRISDASVDVHPLYLQTYEKSDYKLECLTKDFFDRVDAEKIVFFREDRPVGFVLLKVIGEELVFMLCGMDYSIRCNADLYYCMLLRIVEYAIEHRCKTIDFGQTSEKTKLKFGAVLNKKYFYAHHSNPFLNLFAIVGKGLLEYKYRFPEFHVFKEQE